MHISEHTLTFPIVSNHIAPFTYSQKCLITSPGAVKVAVNGLVAAGSVQLASSNIRVNGFAPGFTRTSILTSSSISEKGAEYKIKEDEKQI